MSHTIRKDTRFFFFLNAASLYRLRDMDGAVVLERTSMGREGSRPRFPVEWVSWFKRLREEGTRTWLRDRSLALHEVRMEGCLEG